ncbi:galactosyltransferase-related protein [Rhodoplanes sp. TEM]|uniref:Galactosyltransferase-related protein n=1 Tax=Rhodoplanes tepidamans TaxID=200616 RepID=A0ABT5J771_RHOTP|nr:MULTISPECIES: galactosyltransferase-related protein [Rhodoplanes]MDC7785503.1 galactosyltransferase-related protein [Rhodoplanes tepidamans]MDC7986152.1 galactosyltransferase-related protein [Rhodoplanes sp. TEM]
MVSYQASVGLGDDNAVAGGHLGVVVPFRDRNAHLAEFLPVLQRYLREHRSKAPARTSLLVVEQEPGREFNIAKLKNIGYVLLRDRIDAVCFHDVDYCPVRVDYRCPKRGGVHLVGRGAETVVDPRGFAVSHDMAAFMGGVVAFAKEGFERVNGYSNDYWGWGYEDTDLAARCEITGVPLTRRNGRFRLLPHPNKGYDLAAGQVAPTASHLRNKALFEQRFAAREATDPASLAADGLSTLDFAVLTRATLAEAAPGFQAEKVTVSI